MRLIDIEDMALLKTVSCGGLSAKKLWKRIKEQPTIDAVEVVRCKDCKHKYVSGNGTTQFYVCDFMDAQYEDNGFCHHGERKGGDSE